MKNIGRFFHILILILFFANGVGAQINSIDLLQKELNSEKNKKKRIELLIEIGNLYLNENPDSSLLYSERIKIKSEISDYQEGIAAGHLLAASALNSKKLFREALAEANLSEKIYQSLENTTGLGNCYYEKGLAYDCIVKDDSCMLFLEKAYDIFYPDFKLQLANIERIKSLSYWSSGNYAEGLIKIDKAIIAYRELNDSVNISKSLNTKGAILWGLTNYERALDVFFEALAIIESSNKSENQLIILYNNIGLVYHDWKYQEKSLEYFKKAEEMIKPSSDKLGKAYTNLNLGTYYLKENGGYEIALDYLLKAMEGYGDMEDINGVSLSKIRIAECYYQNKDFEQAEIMFFEALKDAEKSKNNHRIALTYYHFSKNEYSQNKFQNSLDYSLKSLQIADKGNYKDVKYLLYEHLSVVYEKLGDTNKSLEMLRNSVFYKEEIFEEKIAVQYEIMELTRENELREFEYEQLKLQNELKNKTINYQMIVVIFIALLLAVIIGFYIRLSKKRKALVEANKAKDKIFSIVSHDLRAPVGNLNSLIDTLATEELNEEYRELLNMFKPAITSSYNMLDNLLVWAKANLGKLDMNKEKIDLKSVIKEAILPYLTIADKKSISINSKKHDNIWVYTDYTILQTLIRNLINNAIKFTNENGSIDLYVKDFEKEIHISVKDNGVGISKDIQTTLFKGGNYTLGTHKEAGSGLGLLLCKDLAIKNGGDLWVVSQEGVGSIFSFSVPKIDLK